MIQEYMKLFSIMSATSNWIYLSRLRSGQTRTVIPQKQLFKLNLRDNQYIYLDPAKIVVYGRRRIGKSALLMHIISHKKPVLQARCCLTHLISLPVMKDFRSIWCIKEKTICGRSVKLNIQMKRFQQRSFRRLSEKLGCYLLPIKSVSKKC